MEEFILEPSSSGPPSLHNINFWNEPQLRVQGITQTRFRIGNKRHIWGTVNILAGLWACRSCHSRKTSECRCPEMPNREAWTLFSRHVLEWHDECILLRILIKCCCARWIRGEETEGQASSQGPWYWSAIFFFFKSCSLLPLSRFQVFNTFLQPFNHPHCLNFYQLSFSEKFRGLRLECLSILGFLLPNLSLAYPHPVLIGSNNYHFYHLLFHVILTTTLWERFSYPQFVTEKMDIWSD